MKPAHKQRVKAMLKKRMGRDPRPAEEANMETDSLLLAQFLLEKVEELEDKVAILEKIVIKP